MLLDRIMYNSSPAVLCFLLKEKEDPVRLSIHLVLRTTDNSDFIVRTKDIVSRSMSTTCYIQKNKSDGVGWSQQCWERWTNKPTQKTKRWKPSECAHEMNQVMSTLMWCGCKYWIYLQLDYLPHLRSSFWISSLVKLAKLPETSIRTE